MLAPSFLETRPDALTADMIAAFEASTGKTLYPAQVERLLVDICIYREALVRQAIQSAAEQNLVDFATGDRLEAIARMLGISGRLAATHATCPWQITLPGALGVDTVFHLGWQAVSQDGATWETTASVTIPAGQLTASVGARAAIAGAAQNGIPSGASFSPLATTAAVVSTAASSGGAEAETDDQLRARALLAPFGFSVAGSSGAYAFHAMGANPAITDVAVANLGAGVVGVYPLTAMGLPSQAILDAVSAALSADTVRPLCDSVTVAAPTRVPFTLEANLTIFSTAESAMVQTAALASANAYIADRRAGLGRDLVASQAIKALSVEGVYKVELVSWADRILAASEWADGLAVLHMVGSANG
jgi:phage-related baseplate assembly protein